MDDEKLSMQEKCKIIKKYITSVNKIIEKNTVFEGHKIGLWKSEISKRLLETDVSKLEFSDRVKEKLLNSGYRKVIDILKYSKQELAEKLLSLDGLGLGALAEILDKTETFRDLLGSEIDLKNRGMILSSDEIEVEQKNNYLKFIQFGEGRILDENLYYNLDVIKDELRRLPVKYQKALQDKFSISLVEESLYENDEKIDEAELKNMSKKIIARGQRNIDNLKSRKERLEGIKNVFEKDDDDINIKYARYLKNKKIDEMVLPRRTKWILKNLGMDNLGDLISISEKNKNILDERDMEAIEQEKNKLLAGKYEDREKVVNQYIDSIIKIINNAEKQIHMYNEASEYYQKNDTTNFSRKSVIPAFLSKNLGKRKVNEYVRALKDIDIAELGLPKKTNATIRKCNLLTLYDVSILKISDINFIPGLAPKGMTELIKAIKKKKQEIISRFSEENSKQELEDKKEEFAKLTQEEYKVDLQLVNQEQKQEQLENILKISQKGSADKSINE